MNKYENNIARQFLFLKRRVSLCISRTLPKSPQWSFSRNASKRRSDFELEASYLLTAAKQRLSIEPRVD
jgi:hypothetical protein